jgi:DNA-binding MarR family transcriptional regulator
VTELEPIFNDLVRLQIEVWNSVDGRLREEVGIPLGTYESLRIISRKPCRVFDIAEELIITVGGASKVIDRVEAAGFCVRRANPDDRRSSLIEISPSGAAVLATAIPVVEAELGRRFAAPAAELSGFAKSLAGFRSKEVAAR